MECGMVKFIIMEKDRHGTRRIKQVSRSLL